MRFIRKSKNTKVYFSTNKQQQWLLKVMLRLKQDVGACVVTTGPGGTNTLTGVLGAWLDSVPIIFISVKYHYHKHPRALVVDK
jgi:acetolactate synthase-1/2/3 large subunit